MIRRIIIAIALLALVLLLLYPLARAQAQTNHDRHHPDYQGWVNKNDKGCCNNDDCGELGEDDERTEGGSLLIRVEGTWCPVLPHHYLKRGNVPNASVSHACVLKKQSWMAPASACDRLLCYQPKPGT